MSAIFYRFKSQRQDSRLAIDGTGISVFDLKKEIIIANQMGDGKEFDLGLYDSNGEEYTDDSFIIPRSTSVVVRRLPPARQGKGTAAMYVAGTSASEIRASTVLGAMPPPKGRPGVMRSLMTKRFDGKADEEVPLYPTVQAGPSVGGDEEAAKIAAMFQAEADQWQATQETMATATPVFTAMRGGRGGARGGAGMGRGGGGDRSGGGHDRGHQHNRDLVSEFVDKPLPPGYICYRCGQRGHWIQLCPTNEDKDFDNKPRFKRTTGIPRSFLKTVEGPGASDGPGGGVMITPEGGFVVAQPDMATWEKVQQRSRPKVVTEADVRESAPSDPALACPICSKLFTHAVKTPGSGTAFCEECIQAYLLEHDFTCPDGQEKIGSLDKLEEDWETRRKVDEYIAQEIERRKHDPNDAADDEMAGSAAPEALDGKKADQPSADIKSLIKDEKAARAPAEQSSDPAVLMTQLSQLRMMQKLPNLPQHARDKVDLAYREISQHLHHVQLVRQLSQLPKGHHHMGGNFNQFGHHQPQYPQPPPNLPPAPAITYGSVRSLPSDADATLKLANGRRTRLKRRLDDEVEEGEPQEGTPTKLQKV